MLAQKTFHTFIRSEKHSVLENVFKQIEPINTSHIVNPALILLFFLHFFFQLRFLLFIYTHITFMHTYSSVWDKWKIYIYTSIALCLSYIYEYWKNVKTGNSNIKKKKIIKAHHDFTINIFWKDAEKYPERFLRLR